MLCIKKSLRISCYIKHSSPIHKQFFSATTEFYSPDIERPQHQILTLPKSLIDKHDINPNLKINQLSLPTTPYITDHDRLNGVLDLQKEKNVQLGVDPVNYLYNNRRYHLGLEKTLNVENASLKLDPVYPLTVDETKLNGVVFDYYYRSSFAHKSPKEFEKVKKDYMTYYNFEDDTIDAKAGEQLYAYHFNQLMDKLDSFEDKESVDFQKVQDEFRAASELLTKLVAYNDEWYCPPDLQQQTNSLIMNNMGANIHLCGISETLFRIGFSSNFSSKEILEKFIAHLKSYYKHNVSDEELKSLGINYKFAALEHHYSNKALFNWHYILAYVVEYLKVNNTEDITIVTDSMTSKYLQDTSFLNMQSTWEDWINILAIENPDLRDEIINRHAIMDNIWETKFWELSCIKNQFLYVNMYLDNIEKEDYVKFQKQFFLMYKKIGKITKKLRSNVAKFELDSVSADEYREKVGQKESGVEFIDK